MKRSGFFYLFSIIILNTAAQVTPSSGVVKKDIAVKTANPAIVTRAGLTTRQLPGSFQEVTPVTLGIPFVAPNQVIITTNASLSSVDKDKADTKYYFMDSDANGIDEMIAMHNGFPANDGLRRFSQNPDKTISQSGENGLNLYGNTPFTFNDELYFGEFSPESGNTILVCDRRSNQFFLYRHNGSNYSVFERPYTILSNWVAAPRYSTGDFNGDGKSDLLAWDQSRNEFQVALYKPNQYGILGEGYLQGAGVWLKNWAAVKDINMVTGDFNGDKKSDIALLHVPTGEWWVALSNGTSFVPSAGFKSGVWLKPWAAGTQFTIKAMDVNKDGYCDLIGLNNSNNTIEVALSNGQYFDYKFKPVGISSTLQSAKFIGVAKFNGTPVIAASYLIPKDQYNTIDRFRIVFYQLILNR